MLTPLHQTSLLPPLTPRQITTPVDTFPSMGSQSRFPRGIQKMHRVGWSVTKSKFDDLTKDLKQNLYQACAGNTNLCVKPKSWASKSDLIYKRVFADFFQLVCVRSTFSPSFLSSPLLSCSLKSFFMPRPESFTRARGTQNVQKKSTQLTPERKRVHALRQTKAFVTYFHISQPRSELCQLCAF